MYVIVSGQRNSILTVEIELTGVLALQLLILKKTYYQPYPLKKGMQNEFLAK